MLPLLCPRTCQILFTMHRKNILELRTYVHTSRLFPTPTPPNVQTTNQILSRRPGVGDGGVAPSNSNNKYKVTEKTK